MSQTTTANKTLCRTSGFFVVRTPQLPYETLLQWGSGLQSAAAGEDEERLTAALAADGQLLRERLRQLIEQPEVREAIFVASPSLDASLDQWFKEPSGERGQKVERSLVRYLVRMAGRPTPFGLFSGCAYGRIAEQTHFRLAPCREYRRLTRLDMDYLTTLCEALNRDPELKQALIYFPNSSIYQAAGRVRYVETRMGESGRSHHLVAVETTPYLDATLRRAAAGAKAMDLAAALIQDDPEITLMEAQQFINELIDSQLLVSNLAPLLTGEEPINDLLRQLRQIPSMASVAEALAYAHERLQDIDRVGLGNAPQRYLDITERLKDLPAKIDLSKMFQVDMAKPAPEATLGHAVVEEMIRGVTLLHRVFGSIAGDRLNTFREAFYQRYEDREVPLVEVLDEEVGIGFERSMTPTAEASPLLVGLGFPSMGNPDESIRWGARHSYLMSKYIASAEKKETVLQLEAKELEQVGSPARAPLPDGFTVMGTLVAADSSAVERGEYKVIMGGISGPSGANLLGRFCFADPQMEEGVRRHISEEEALQPHAIFAEIVHLPEGRIGNILARPVLRQYEIAYLGRSGAAPEMTIPITDLMVSVKGGPTGRVTLRSRRLDKEIIPRLTSAHNIVHPHNTGVYKFLTALQAQSVFSSMRIDSLRWDWGALEGQTFLPRVVCGKLVFAKARWVIGGDDVRNLNNVTGAQRFREVQKFRAKHRLPRWVLVADGDNELPVDLENVLSIDTFVQLVHDRPQFRLEEMYPDADELCTEGPEGRFTHEIVVPMVLNRDPSTSNLPQRSAKTPSVTRSYIPGSPWLYFKLYTGTSTADQVLREIIAPVAEQAMAAGACQRWFFIRYGDPDWHVRLRFYGDGPTLAARILPALYAAAEPALQSGGLHRLLLDTYHREWERYGGDVGIELFEHFSHIDSQAVIDIVKLLAGDEGADARWRLVLRGMDTLMDDAGLTTADKMQVITACRETFGREHGADVTGLKDQLGQKFRNERKSIEQLLDPANDMASPLWPGLEIIRRRSGEWGTLWSDLRAHEQADRLTMPLLDLMPSYLHMHANRLLRSAARAQELVIYDFLKRVYESRAARERKAGIGPVVAKPKKLTLKKAEAVEGGASS
ncbi:MAG: Nisin biosynthesis protein NisB [Phycisphaerae bacterium]|nr:Nisin biosynthesis protein NisB [Phycisphaerae bacterium]